MPSVAACDSPTSKTPVTKSSDWFADAGWLALEFHLDEPGYFQYSWTKSSDTDGLVQAVGDLDCDGTKAFLIVEVSIATGNVFETITTDITD